MKCHLFCIYYIKYDGSSVWVTFTPRVNEFREVVPGTSGLSRLRHLRIRRRGLRQERKGPVSEGLSELRTTCGTRGVGGTKRQGRRDPVPTPHSQHSCRFGPLRGGGPPTTTDSQNTGGSSPPSSLSGSRHRPEGKGVGGVTGPFGTSLAGDRSGLESGTRGGRSVRTRIGDEGR